MQTVLHNLPDLPGELDRLLAQVPRGRVTTYGTLAAALGDPIAARWVGHRLLHHEHADDCTCHRVVRATGELGRYVTGSVEEKARRLIDEDVPVDDGKIDLDRFCFDDFRSPRPLAALAKAQRALPRQISLCSQVRRPRLVAGVDVSYKGDEAVASYALVDVVTGELLWETVVRRTIAFPYISSYLAFRELPILLELLAEVRRCGRPAEVLLVDGAGIMHPRGAGIAVHLGVVAEVPTVGVTKKLLYGKVDVRGMQPGEVRSVLDGRRKIGIALLPYSGTARPLYVSPGHRISVDAASRLAQRALRERRLLEPIYWADRLSRRAARTVI